MRRAGGFCELRELRVLVARELRVLIASIVPWLSHTDAAKRRAHGKRVETVFSSDQTAMRRQPPQPKDGQLPVLVVSA